MHSNKLLIDEPPLQALPSLAVSIGLEDAIFIQQLHYWLRDKRKNHQDIHEGKPWVKNKLDGWYQQYKFWSPSTIRRIISRLEKSKLVLSTNRWNASRQEQSKWYTIDYEVFATLVARNEQLECEEESNSTDQNEQLSGSNRTDDELLNMSKSINNTKNTKTTSKDIKDSSRKRTVYDEESDYMKLARYFVDKIKSFKPDFVMRSDIQKWADEFRKINEIDKRKKRRIVEVIDWVAADPFWHANILSPDKLRKQFDAVELRMQQHPASGQGSTNQPEHMTQHNSEQKSAWDDAMKRGESEE